MSIAVALLHLAPLLDTITLVLVKFSTFCFHILVETLNLDTFFIFGGIDLHGDFKPGVGKLSFESANVVDGFLALLLRVTMLFWQHLIVNFKQRSGILSL